MTNYIKKQRHNNYAKAEQKAILKYYKPLLDWWKYNNFKIMMREGYSKEKAL